MKVHVLRAKGTDGFRHLAEYDDGGEAELPGWFGSQQIAVDAARGSYPEAEIRGVTADEGGWDSWTVEDWLYNSAYSDVDEDTADAELAVLVERYAADALVERVALDGDILEYLREVRANKAS